MKIYQILFVAIILLSSSCVKNKKGHPQAQQSAVTEKVFVINEIAQTSSYTYLKVTENHAERWVAVSRMDAKQGEKYYYDNALLMNNFHSKELDRDFESIYFINKVSSIPFSMQKKMSDMPKGHSGNTGTKQKSAVSLKKADTEITVAQVFEKRTNFANKEIEIRGVVVKINEQVMGKNWIHIQDGSEHNGSFDLTITSTDLPKKGDEVTFKGTIILEKDFGAGYFYDVIMEGATLLKTQKVAVQL